MSQQLSKYPTKKIMAFIGMLIGMAALALVLNG
jgi:hypothetical protein